MKTKIILPILAAILCGCASLDPGANALIVRTEQTETIAYATFDTFLKIDDANRGFFRTNAPAMHNFAELLRTPTTIDLTNTLPQGVAWIESLDRVKQAYKAGLASSNAVVTALATVETAITQAQQYITTANPRK